jgi:hypothetical protein
MNRPGWILPCLTGLLVVSSARAQQPADVKATIEYVRKLQTGGGGFLSQAPAPNIRIAPTLRATSSAVRALHYLGGEVPDKAACIKFVESCFDENSGGFSDFPKGKPDVFTTAVGIMAVTELKMPLDKFEGAAIKYLSDNSKGFDDIRIAVAGLERLGKKSPKTKEWRKVVGPIVLAQGDDNPKNGVAREVGSLAVTHLRLGAKKLDNPDPVIQLLRNGQQKNGAYGKLGTETSDLESTYRVMRAFVMLKAQPKNLEALRSFVAKCRNDDGGYGITPGQSSNVSATYFAAIIRHWMKDMK